MKVLFSSLNFVKNLFFNSLETKIGMKNEHFFNSLRIKKEFFFKLWVLFLDSTQAQVETRILSLILVVWWTGFGSPQLYWADYEPSCAQNMDPTIHTHLYIQNIYVLQSREQ